MSFSEYEKMLEENLKKCRISSLVTALYFDTVNMVNLIQLM